jgi:hypothetical protein
MHFKARPRAVVAPIEPEQAGGRTAAEIEIPMICLSRAPAF